jgi:DNA replication and repair protein RecF
MQIKSLSLTNWRNFLDKKIDFNSTIVLIGKNGRGKTNILESIYLLATTKSFRTTNNSQLINWQADFCRVEGKIETREKEKSKIELVINKNPERKFQKKGKINGAPKKLLDLLGVLKVVLFSPEMIEMIYASPVSRRRYLDSVLVITDHKYAANLFNFNQVLKRRNKLLNRIQAGLSHTQELDFWDSELAKSGAYIILRREALVDFYNQKLPSAYQEISDNPREEMRLKYLNSLMRKEKKSLKLLIKNYQQALIEKRVKEIEIGATLVGPQRDELIFVLNDKKIADYGSRGEFRSAILALKMVEINYLAEISQGSLPVLLLDDVFSELDENRRHKLAKIIKNIQAIITTTDIEHLDPSLQKMAKIIRLE